MKRIIMKRMLRTLGTTAVLGALALTAQPAFAISSGQAMSGQAMSGQADHNKHHQQIHGDGQSGMMGHMEGGDPGSIMGNDMGHMTSHMDMMSVNNTATVKDLSVEDVKKIVEGRLAWNGNKRLKVGEVKKKNDDTYTADIVTVDNSLVERLEIDRKTGSTRRAE